MEQPPKEDPFVPEETTVEQAQTLIEPRLICFDDLLLDVPFSQTQESLTETRTRCSRDKAEENN